MALVVTGGRRRRVGKNIVHQFNVAFDSSYPTEGEALPASARGDGWDDSNVKQVNLRGWSNAAQPVKDASHFYLYDEAADKVAAWTSAAEVANTTDLAAKAYVRAEVVCRI